MDKKTSPRTNWASLRITKADLLDITGQAKLAGISRSELIRLRVANKPVISRADIQTARSIDQLGRMLKHLYPKGKAWADQEDKKRWWRLVEELRETTKNLRGSQEDEKCSPK